MLVARLLPNGALDASYGSAGFATVASSEPAGALLVRADGTAVAAAYVSGAVVVLGLDALGRVRAGYGTRISEHEHEPFPIDDPVLLAAGPGHTVLVAGNDRLSSRSWGWVARLRASGRLDRRFARRGRLIPGGTSHRLHFNAMARDRRGRILLAGHQGTPGSGRQQAAVVRVTPSGRLDRRFGIVVEQIGALPGVRLVASDVGAVAADAHNRILLAGTAYDDAIEIREDLGRSYFAVARLKG
jgi:Domain of unknown function (DUF5122) beta-propeller